MQNVSIKSAPSLGHLWIAENRLYSWEARPAKEKPSLFSKLTSLSTPIERIILRSRVTQDGDLARILGKAGSTAIYGFSLLTIAGTMGIDTTPIVTGLGITGFAAGFAMKEIATNFLSGLILVFSKPFIRGQRIRVLCGGTQPEGTVESIDSRYVLLRSKEGSLVMVPSAVVYSNSLIVDGDSSESMPLIEASGASKARSPTLDGKTA